VTDRLEVGDVLDAATLERIRGDIVAAAGAPAGLLGAGPPSARKATRVEVSDATRAAVVELLTRLQPRIAAHFGRPLDGFEEPQFLRYGEGDYFVAHQDGNTPLIHDESRLRKVSVVLFLSAPGSFGGGALVLHGEPSVTLLPPAGTLVAFPSETTHEVLPITHGARLSVVWWYRG
jgi:SM-20-related protein